MKRTIRFLKVAILTLFGACTILLVGGIHFSATNIIESPDFLEPTYQNDEFFEGLNPKSDNFGSFDELLKEKNAPEVIQL
jgi:hypothetical protein